MNSRFYFIIIFLVATVVIGFFLVWPKYQQILVVQSEIERAKIDIQEGEEYFSNLRNLSGRLKEYQGEFEKINAALPKKFYLPHLYDFFPDACSRNGLVLNGINSSISSSERSEVKEILITLEVSGTYSSFKDFLSYLKSSARFFGIENLSFSSSPEEENFKFNLSVKTHSY